MNDKELDAIVTKIKEPVLDLDELIAELLMAHAYFEVVVTIALYQGKGTENEIRNRILGSLDAFFESNPLPTTKTH